MVRGRISAMLLDNQQRPRGDASHSTRCAAPAPQLKREWSPLAIFGRATEVITISQIHASRTDSRVRVRYTQPRSRVSVARLFTAWRSIIPAEILVYAQAARTS